MTRAVVLALALAASGLAACSAGTEPSGAPFEVPGSPVATTTVELPKSYRFEPAAIAISPGQSVTWTNTDDFPHNVHLLDGTDRTLDLPIGGSGQLSFDEAGDVYYECSLHPQQMHGRIVVG